MTTTIGAQLSDWEEHSSPRYLIQVLNKIRVMLPSHEWGFVEVAGDNQHTDGQTWGDADMRG